MRFAIAVAAIMATQAAAAPTERYEKKVEVAGATYRVNVRDGIVTVAKKTTFVRFDIRERDRMREAVKVATGCAVVDEIPLVGKLRGKLSCPTPQ